MIRWYRHTNLRTKLMLINMLVAVPVLVLFAAASIYGQYYFQRQSKIDNLQSVARVLAENSRAAMLFQDSEAATGTLASLEELPFVSEGTLFQASGEMFASYRRDAVPVADAHALMVRVPVIMDGEDLGDLVLSADTSVLVQSVLRSLYILLGVFLVSLLVLVYLSNRLQRWISSPLVRLQRAMQQFGEQHSPVGLNYDANDEVGQLYTGFGDMMEEIHRKDKKVQEYQDHLTDLVEQRTEALTRSNESLVAAIEKAEQASQVKSEFIATMSHEIRTPLNGLLGMVHLMHEEQLGQKQRRRLEVMRTTGHSLLHIVNEILDFSKLQADKLVLDPTLFNLRLTLEGIAKEFAHVCAPEVDVLLDLPELADVEVLADEARLRQVVYNLMSNAVKFTREGTVTLRMQLAEQVDAGKVVFNVSVCDSGIGIARDKLDSISKAFYQADGSTSREFGGTGLGLSISRSLLNLMDSELEIESELGKGSQFGFDLTCEGSVTFRTVVLEDKAHRVAVQCHKRERARLLVRQLTLLGIEPTLVTGVSALYDAEPFSEIFTDNMMLGTTEPLDLTDTSRVICLTHPSQTAQLNIEYCLELPGLLDDLQKLLNRTVEAPQPQRQTVAMRKERIMVVDDGAVNRETAAGFLTNDGFQLIFADDGGTAFDLFKAQGCDLILMDCSMPVIDGFAAASLIRDHEDNRGLNRVPIVAMTAHDWSEVEARCVAAGMDDYLGKPFDPGQLRKTVARWLQLEDIEATELSVAPEPASDDEFDGSVFDNIFSVAPTRAKALCVRLIDAYFEEVPQRVASIGEAVSSEDLTLLTRTAHAMRSSAANLGLRKLQDWCRRVESLNQPIGRDEMDELEEIIQSAGVYLRSKYETYTLH